MRNGLIWLVMACDDDPRFHYRYSVDVIVLDSRTVSRRAEYVKRATWRVSSLDDAAYEFAPDVDRPMSERAADAIIDLMVSDSEIRGA